MSAMKYFHRVTLASWRVAIAVAVAAALLAVGLMGFGGGSAGAASVAPVYAAGNPTCQDLGYAFGYRVDPPNAGTYSVGPIGSVTVTTDGTYFSWTSTFGVDAVVSKGGSNANVFVYDPPAESFGDTDLVSPTNPSNSKPFGLSHIDFCYDIELAVSKTAATSFDRTYEWEIEKSGSASHLDLFAGDSATVDYDVTVDVTGYTDDNFSVTGEIEIFNPHPSASATITSIVDQLSDGTLADVDCSGVTVVGPQATVVCEYSANLDAAVDGTNTVTVTSTGVPGGSGEADYAFGDPTNLIDECITVTDSYAGDLETVCVDDELPKTFQYERSVGPFASVDVCPTAAIDNTAEFTTNDTATTGFDDWDVSVTCYELAVTKNATTSFTRTWDWTIDKSADQSDLLLSDGQLFQVNYAVKVDATSSDSDFAVSGDIWVANPNPSSVANLMAVNDLISPAIAAAVDCPSLTVPAGGTLHCTYSAALPDDTARTNTAIATLQNYAYAADGTGTASGTTDFSGTATVAFDMNNPGEVVDECIDVLDTNVGNLGTVCAGDAPKTFTYSLMFGAHADADVELECGTNTHVNVASFVTNDSGTTGSDNWTVNADVACLQGCTLTQGYWKTHSKYGPAPADDAWYNLGDINHDGISEGPDETFFLSGKTYYEVLWTPPAGNAYYNLAHQYIAAKLNIVNGASVPAEVQSAMAAAETLLSSKTPAQIATLKGQAKSQVTSLAATLDAFNNGLIGPGHCDE